MLRRVVDKQTTSSDNLWPEIWKDVAEAAQRKEKQKWAIEKPKLDNARRLRGICFIDPDDTEYSENYRKCKKTGTSTNNGSWYRVHLLHGGIGKTLGGLLTIQKVKKEVSQVLSERGDPLLHSILQNSPKMAFENSIHFVTDGSFTADGGLL